MRTLTFLIALLLLVSCGEQPPLTLSVIGTNDVHGQLLQNDDRGGLVNLSGYVAAVRNAREQDGGAVLLIDAGDMWQGTLESNLSEGAAMVEAFNAMGYAAAAIGNHEFDFGPVGEPATPSEPGHDPRGALKERAREAAFPILAANLIDEETGLAVNWDNVQPSVSIDVQGVKVGIIGVMAANALQRTTALNVKGLYVAPLVPAIEEQATLLREAGATFIIVTAHAGSTCTEFQNPNDLSSCNEMGEIFRVASELPQGLVDHIIAGHVHQGIAHIVNGTSITASYSSTRAFGRTDFTIDRRNSAILDRTLFPPHLVVPDADYESQQIVPQAEVIRIAETAQQAAKEKRGAKLGIRLETPFTLRGGPESALGNLYTRALHESLDVDVAVLNVLGGMRTGLPAGDLNFGDVYEMSPFENRTVIADISGADLRLVVAESAFRGPRSVGFAGMTVIVTCSNSEMDVRIELADGRVVVDSDSVRVAVSDYLATGGDGVLTRIIPDGGFIIDETQPFVRDVLVEWLSNKGGSINADDFHTMNNPIWNRPENLDRSCRLAR